MVILTFTNTLLKIKCYICFHYNALLLTRTINEQLDFTSIDKDQ